MRRSDMTSPDGLKKFFARMKHAFDYVVAYANEQEKNPDTEMPQPKDFIIVTAPEEPKDDKLTLEMAISAADPEFISAAIQALTASFMTSPAVEEQHRVELLVTILTGMVADPVLRHSVIEALHVVDESLHLADDEVLSDPDRAVEETIHEKTIAKEKDLSGPPCIHARLDKSKIN